MRLCPWMDGIAQGARTAVRLCPWMDGIAQGARTALRLCPWMDGIAQGARTAMRLCPWMDGQTFAPRQLLLLCPTKLHPCNDATSALPPSMVVVFAQGARTAGALSRKFCSYFST
jgi:hypothetical protein